MQRVIERFASLIKGGLSGFDRLRLGGTKRMLSNVGGMKEFLWQSKVLLKDFDAFAQDTTGTLCRAVEQSAKDQGRPLVFISHPSQDKYPLVEEVAARDGVKQGLIGV